MDHETGVLARGAGPAYRMGMRFSAGAALPLVLLSTLVLSPGSVVAAPATVDIQRAPEAAAVVPPATDPLKDLFIHGQYDEVIAQTAAPEALQDQEKGLLRCQALLQRGRYAESRTALESQLATFPNSLRLRLLGGDIYRLNGLPERAKAMADELDRLGPREWLYQEPPDRVALGQAALLVKADPKKVLDRFFTPLMKAPLNFREAYLASGELALKKGDAALAAKKFSEAAKLFPDDPDVQFGLARAYQGGDAEATQAALEATLKENPNHIAAHLMLAEYHIDAEHPEQAAEAVAAVLKVDPLRPEAHALRAVQAELAGNRAGFEEARTAALRPWPHNPAVEHLIGRKLSQKYRFAEGAAHQRRALEWEPENLEAKLQLAQDLLRLSEEKEGWALAQEVRDADPYDVVAYNLVALQEQLAKFTSLPSAHFLVRMDPHEAEVFGPKVLEVLEHAYQQVGAKYGLDPKQRTTVEIFPDQRDFAIRTFGLPGGQGYLGVCFGNVITAVSPAAMPGSANNWESVLWHEFTHVVTLGLSKNRMPRWLSEGISVYEERQARGNWGEQMKPRYRAMILGPDFVPLSQLSGAFLKPKSPVHLMFAYYESSLAVEFLLEKMGLPGMKTLFADLAKGVGLNAALATHAESLTALDQEFAERAKKIAQGVGPQLDWTAPTAAETSDKKHFAEWIASHPTNYYALKEQARLQLAARDWEGAREPLLKLIELYPQQHEADGAYAMLAKVQREAGEQDAELTTLTKLVALTSDATDALQRLMEIHAERGEWPLVAQYADQYAAVNPLVPVPHRLAARAYQELHDAPRATASLETLLKVGGGPVADAHFQLAGLLRQADKQPEAKRHLLQALEEAPRYREALRVLVEMEGSR